MKKILVLTAFLTLAFVFKAESKTPYYNDEFGFFYSALSPHGSWLEIDAGLVVWRPTIMRRGWSPYRNGYWIWTIDGWYWESYEPFGYITYHYGRWYYDDYYGWIWLPDNEWAPSWVEWRYSDAYIGWAPLPPYAAFSINIGIHFTHNYYTPYHHWHYVQYDYFCDPYVYNHYVGSKHKYRIHSKTKYRTNYDYYDGRIVNRGVDINYVRERTGQNIRQREIERYSDPGEFERVRSKGERDNNVVRTFTASRDRISREDFRDVEIKKSDRKSSLNTSKIEIGRRDISRNNDRKVTDETNEKSSGRDSEKIEKKSNENRRSDTKRNNNVKVRRNEEIKRNSTNDIRKKNDQPVIEREQNQERKSARENNNSNIRTESKDRIEERENVNPNFDNKRSNEDVMKREIEKRNIGMKKKETKNYQKPNNSENRKRNDIRQERTIESPKKEKPTINVQPEQRGQERREPRNEVRRETQQESKIEKRNDSSSDKRKSDDRKSNERRRR